MLAAAAERARLEAERRAIQVARDARERAAARSRYLDTLAGREEQVWNDVEQLLDVKRAREYDQAVQLMLDLNELAIRESRDDAFFDRLAELRARYARRPALIDRLERAGLG